jgi:hypothetical protein
VIGNSKSRNKNLNNFTLGPYIVKHGWYN